LADSNFYPINKRKKLATYRAMRCEMWLSAVLLVKIESDLKRKLELQHVADDMTIPEAPRLHKAVSLAAV
jgi:hypothetical protein